jgi:glycerate dehydrogenase
VVADGHTTNPGDLDWGALAALGELTVHDRSGPLLYERVRDADIVLTNKERFDGQMLERLPRLRFISVLATGTDVIDLDAARRRGIVVSNVPAYSTDAVAQHAFALLLALRNRVAEHAAAARDGRWSSSGDFSFRLEPISELAGKTLGIVGFGNIGQAVARIGNAFGMRIATVARPLRIEPPFSVQRLELDELFACSDVLTLHCPLTPETAQLVNRRRLASMRRSAVLLNTGRGGLVDEQALRSALDQGVIAGAGLDVLSVEPPPATHPLLDAPNCLVTPHLAWASTEARRRLIDVSAANVRAFSNGSPQNVVT